MSIVEDISDQTPLTESTEQPTDDVEASLPPTPSLKVTPPAALRTPIRLYGRDHRAILMIVEEECVLGNGRLDASTFRAKSTRRGKPSPMAAPYHGSVLADGSTRDLDDFDVLDDLVEAGLIERDGKHVNPTERGWALAHEFRRLRANGFRAKRRGTVKLDVCVPSHDDAYVSALLMVEGACVDNHGDIGSDHSVFRCPIIELVASGWIEPPFGGLTWLTESGWTRAHAARRERSTKK